MKKIGLLTVLFFVIFWTKPVGTAMNGGNFSIPIDSFTITEDGIGTGGNFSLLDSTGDYAAGNITNGSTVLEGGFFHASSGATLSLSLNNSALNIGTLSISSVGSVSTIATITAGEANGYSLTINEDGNFRTGTGEDINDVANGQNVTAGVESYGFRTSGTNALYNSSDKAITTANLVIASSNQAVSNDAVTVEFKAGISDATATGIYSHSVVFTLSENP